jgi:hypothetical protein
MDLSNLVLTGADYKILWIIGTKTFPILTADNISYNDTIESEQHYAVGETKPIALKRNGEKTDGKLSIQNGEMADILSTLGYVKATQIENSILTIVATAGPLKRTHVHLNINGGSVDIKAKDKATLISLDWECLEVV